MHSLAMDSAMGFSLKSRWIWRRCGWCDVTLHAVEIPEYLKKTQVWAKVRIGLAKLQAHSKKS